MAVHDDYLPDGTFVPGGCEVQVLHADSTPCYAPTRVWHSDAVSGTNLADLAPSFRRGLWAVARRYGRTP
eukprot:884407-Rhodomonas_salina.4